MWKKLIELVRDVFELRFQIKGHEKRLDDFGKFSREMTAEFNKLSERVMKLEIQLENQRQQQTTERENFRLQIENLVLRMQRGLPPGEQND